MDEIRPFVPQERKEHISSRPAPKKYHASKKKKKEASRETPSVLQSEQRITQLSDDIVMQPAPLGSPFVKPLTHKRKIEEQTPSVHLEEGAQTVSKKLFTASQAAKNIIINKVARGGIEYAAFAFGGVPGLALAKVVQIAYDLHQHNYQKVESNTKRLLEAVILNQFNMQAYAALKTAEVANDLFQKNWKGFMDTIMSLIPLETLTKESAAENKALLQEVYTTIKDNESIQSLLIRLFSLSPEMLKNFVKVFIENHEELQDLVVTLGQRAQELQET